MSTLKTLWVRRRKRLLIGIALGLVVFFGLPLALSPLAKSAINRRLATLPGYDAHVGGVRVAVWKLAVDIDDFVLSDKGHLTDGPLVKVLHGSMTVLPGALMRGKVSGHGSINDTELLILHDEPRNVKGDTKEELEKKADTRAARAVQWQRALQERFDIEISRFELLRTKIRFVDRSTPGNPEMVIDDFHMVAKNLKTRAKPDEELPAHIEMSGHFPGGGTLRGDAALAPLEIQPRFKAAVEVKDLNLPAMHDFLKSYAFVDVRKGTFEVFIEADAKGGHYAGYVKPFFHDLEFKAVSDPKQGFLRHTATTVASAVSDLLKNEKEKIATKVPFEGEINDTDIDIFAALANLLRNAFIQSLREGFEGRKPTG